LFPGREMSASESRIFLDFRLFVALRDILHRHASSVANGA
jgi:hypothetical protein